KLAAQKLAQEKPGQTLQATALVHEAYLRLVDTGKVQDWNSRGHFFAAAAEAMCRILVEQARRRNAAKRGGQAGRKELDEAALKTFGAGYDVDLSRPWCCVLFRREVTAGVWDMSRRKFANKRDATQQEMENFLLPR